MKSFTFNVFEHLFLKKSHIFKWPVSQTLRQKHYCVFNFLSYWLKNLLFRVPGQGRLAISRLRVPNLDSCVPAAAGDLFSIGAPRHWCDPEITRSQYTNQQNQRGENLEKNLPARVPGQRRLALKSARWVHDPDFHCLVNAAAGKLAVRVPRHRPHTVSVKN